MKKTLLFIAVVALICSCSTPKATSYSYSEYKTISPSQSVFTAPLMADLVVAKERITYAERINQNITKLTDAEVEALANREKETVIANAVKANNADVLVAPMVNITTDANKNLVIVVCGYPATYQNFRNATESDQWIIERANAEKEQNVEKKSSPIADIFKKKSK
ncbi:MAG: hypothetical protein IJ650_05815 [Paludibacteraceae bacterium]|nr:hypothetical protein [Paludibacteraceae bacterium]